MELKEAIEAALEEYGATFPQKLSIMTLVEMYGDARFNAALDKAAENAKVKTERFGGVGGVKIKVFNIVDKDSILNLKIPNK